MQPVTRRRWSERGTPPTGEVVQRLSTDLKLHPLAAAVLARRGYCNPAAAVSFLDPRLQELPDPFLLSGMEKAVTRLGRAIAGGELIAVHGDYDVDGISGTTLLVESLRAFGAQVVYFIPQRMRDGYGLSAEALRQAAEQGCTVAVSVDCGISACAEADLARKLGLDLIITDHHHPPAILPQAFALINPQLPGDRYPFRELAGVGVAFMLLVALRKSLREAGHFATRPEPDLRQSLDLVALGTIADIVPLTGVNRILTRSGLQIINQGGRPGLRALRDVAGIVEVTCSGVAFGLAPRLNAAGRLEDAAQGVALLLDPDYQHAKGQAAELDRINRERQLLEQQTFAAAIAQLEALGRDDAFAIVLANREWHPGVIGIVASRMVERYHRPTVMIALDDEGRGKGSARSIPGFHLYESLQGCAAQLLGFGGHAAAAGLSLDVDCLDCFAAVFEEVARVKLADELPAPAIGHDGEAAIEELSLAAVADLDRLAPFGASNPEPLFVLRGVRVQQLAPCGEKHLRFTVRQGGVSLPCIAFNFSARRQELLEGEVDLLVAPQKNEWKGRISLQLRVKDVRPGE